MDTVLIQPFIDFLQGLPAEAISMISLIVCVVTLLLLLRWFGLQGLYLYNVVAVLASNIQVLKGVQFTLSAEPIALGTILFSSTYLCSDIITEHYGKDLAKRGVWLSFIAQLLMTLFMMIAVGHRPIATELLGSPGTEHMSAASDAMSILFTPAPRLLFASLLAFTISQLSDIAIFQSIARLTQRKFLWMRTLISTLSSALIDTVLFSVLAWVILAPNPIRFSTLIFTYILGTFIARAIVSVIAMPIMYTSYRFLPLKQDYAKSF